MLVRGDDIAGCGLVGAAERPNFHRRKLDDGRRGTFGEVVQRVVRHRDFRDCGNRLHQIADVLQLAQEGVDGCQHRLGARPLRRVVVWREMKEGSRLGGSNV